LLKHINYITVVTLLFVTLIYATTYQYYGNYELISLTHSSQWYFRNTNAPTGPTAKASTDTDSFPTVPADKNTPKDANATKGTAQTSVTGSYSTSTTPLYTLARIFVGPALAAQTLTGSQTGYKVATGTKESSLSMNLYMRTFVYVWRSGSGNVKTIIVPTSCTVEHGTSEKGCVITATGASGDFSILANDRIVVEIWFDIRNTKATAYTATLYYDGTTDPVDGTATSNAASYFYCPQTLNLYNFAPTNGAGSITDRDDTNNIYAQKKLYTGSSVATDTDGYADIHYMEFRLKQGATTRAAFQYHEDDNSFNIQTGSTAWNLDASSSANRLDNTITVTWKFTPQWDATEESGLSIELYVIDSVSQSDTDTVQTNYVDVVTRLVTSGFTSDDSRINIGGTTTISGIVYYGNDPTSNVASTSYPPDAEFTSVSIHDSAHASQATDDTIVNGAFSVNFAIPSAVQSNTYHVYIDMADADYTDADAVDSDTKSVIGDRIEIYSQTLDDSRVNINTNIEFRVQARLDFDDHALGSEDSLTANAGSMVWDSANGWFDAQRSQGTVGSYTFQVSSGNEVTYGITSIYVGVSNPTGVWDRIKVYWEQLNDSRVDIGSAIEGRYKAVLDYDDHPLGSGDSMSVSWGSLTWDSENEWWDIPHSESVVTGITITGWSGNEVTYGITSITENITETTYIYDRIEIYEKDDPIIVNEFWQTQNLDQQVIPTYVLFYPLLVCTVFPFLGIKNKKKAKASTFILLLSFLVVIVPNININTVFASDETVTVNTYVIIWFRARYDYDNVTYSDSSGSTLSINATSATYNSTAGALYWYRNVTQSTPGEYVYTVTAISDGVYGLTTFNNIIGYITITFTDPPPTYSNVGTNSTLAGQPCEFYTLWNDNTNVSGFIFGTNNTGSWENDTWVAFSVFYNSTAAWSNVTKTLNSTIDVVIQWQIWCNDTGNNWNNTGIQTFATILAYKLNLRVMDWDLTDAIANAYVTMNNGTDYVQVSDGNGWANYTGLSGTVTVKVQYFGFWVNGTFSVTMDSDKTINVQCKLYDVTVLVQEGVQNAYLVSANVTVYNSTSVQGNKITSGVTENNGQVQLLNLPNSTLTFTQYGGTSYSLVIGNITQQVSNENQPITLTADQNSVNTNNSYSIIAFAGVTIPLKGGFVTGRLKKKRRNK